MTKHIWLNGGTVTVPPLNLAYGHLKTVFKGERPFVVPRHIQGIDIQPNVINVFPDSMLDASTSMQSPETLESLMDKSANRIVDQFVQEAKGLLYVWWSGGLDSTAILTCLMNNPVFAQLLLDGRVRIVCNEDSKQEYPQYWDRIVSKLPKVESDLSLYLEPDTFHVDGMWADELFGNYQAEFYPHGGTDSAYNLLAQLEKITYRAPLIAHFLDWAKFLEQRFPSETLFQRLWWLEFTLAYQDANLRPYYNGSNRVGMTRTRQRFNENLPYQWFAHPSWNAWAMQRQLVNRFANYRESKQELRDYILARTRDEDYVLTKQKEYSQGRMYYGWKNGITENWVPY